MKRNLAYNLSAGQRFARWTVIEMAPRKPGPRRWKCLCTCGTARIVDGYSLAHKRSKSCGCMYGKRPRGNRDEASERKINRIIELVAKAFGYTAHEMKSRRREMPLARRRLFGYWLAREITNASMPTIARVFNREDHTTVLHGIRVMELVVPNNPDLQRVAQIIKREFVVASKVKGQPQLHEARA